MRNIQKERIKSEIIYLGEETGFCKTNTSIGDSYRTDYHIGSWFSWRLEDTFMFSAVLSAYRYSHWWHRYNFTSSSINYTYPLGLSLSYYPYYNPTPDNWNFISEIEDYYSLIFDVYNELGHEIDYSFIHTEENGLIYFESYNGGRINNGDFYLATGEFKDMNGSLSYGSQFQIAIEKYTGVVKGLRYRG